MVERVSGCAFIEWEHLRRFVAVGDRCRWLLPEEPPRHAIIEEVIVAYNALVTDHNRYGSGRYVRAIRSRELYNRSARNFSYWGAGEWRAGAARLIPWTL